MTTWAEPPSLREWLWVELVAPVTFMLVFVPAFLVTFAVLALVYDVDTAEETIDRWVSKLEEDDDE